MCGLNCIERDAHGAHSAPRAQSGIGATARSALHVQSCMQSTGMAALCSHGGTDAALRARSGKPAAAGGCIGPFPGTGTASVQAALQLDCGPLLARVLPVQLQRRRRLQHWWMQLRPPRHACTVACTQAATGLSGSGTSMHLQSLPVPVPPWRRFSMNTEPL